MSDRTAIASKDTEEEKVVEEEEVDEEEEEEDMESPPECEGGTADHADRLNEVPITISGRHITLIVPFGQLRQHRVFPREGLLVQVHIKGRLYAMFWRFPNHYEEVMVDDATTPPKTFATECDAVKYALSQPPDKPIARKMAARKKAYHTMITYLVKKTGADGRVGRTVRETLHLRVSAATFRSPARGAKEELPLVDGMMRDLLSAASLAGEGEPRKRAVEAWSDAWGCRDLSDALYALVAADKDIELWKVELGGYA